MTTTEVEAEKQKFYFHVAPNVWGMKDIFVNVYIVKDDDSDKWVLIDTGLKSSGKKIKKMASDIFGEGNAVPKAIILTHGHFDHVGSVQALAEEWHVPVYAHYLEMPYLTGKSSYPPCDPTVGGGLMSDLSFLYSMKPIDISSFVAGLPEDNSVPFLAKWKWIHTPGHAPGHISLYREEDKTMIVGDAFITTKGESAFNTLLQIKKVSRPPAYGTTDWFAAYESVKKLLLMQPEVVATGHGKPMYGTEMLKQLVDLVEHFADALPKQGRYVGNPAVQDASGVEYLPPAYQNPYRKAILIASGLLFASAVVVASTKLGKKKRRFF